MSSSKQIDIIQNDNPQESYRDREYDEQIKIVLVGDSSVGKSSLLLRFIDNTFSECYQSTIGVDFKFKTIEYYQKLIKLQIWDTAGQEKFRCLSNAYYKGARSIVLIFDMTNRVSFLNIPQWINQIDEYADNDPIISLVGNKSDLVEQQQVTLQEIDEFAQKIKIRYYLVSAKANQNVEMVFLDIIEQVFKEELQQHNNNEDFTSKKQLSSEEKSIYLEKDSGRKKKFSGEAQQLQRDECCLNQS